jgi:hypothetical protein
MLGRSSIIFMVKCQRLRERLPFVLELEVSKAVEEILSHPCRLVVKAQSQSAHWLLLAAIIKVLNLHLIFGIKIATPLPMVEDEEEEER